MRFFYPCPIFSFMGASRIISSILLFIFGIFEGVRVTLTPAFSRELTGTTYFHFTVEEYGLLFLPYSVAAIFAALYVGGLIARKGLYKSFLLAILCDLLSMYFMGMTLVASISPLYSFISLSVALFLSGAGFGLVLPVINTLISHIYPKKTEVFIVLFYLSLSVGSTLLFSFSSIQNYFYIAILVFSVVYIFLYLLCDFFKVFPSSFVVEKAKKPLKALWSLISAMVFVGFLESLFFNWTLLYLKQSNQFDTEKSNALYLTFLAFFTVSQIIYALLLKVTSFDFLIVCIPTILSVICLTASLIFNASNAFILFSLIGLFLSANLPFLVGYAKKMGGNQPKIFGFLVAAHTFGYGVCSYGFGLIDLSKNTVIVDLFFSLALVFAAAIVVLNTISVMRERRVETPLQ